MARLPDFLSLEYRADGGLAAVAPLPGKTVSNVGIGVFGTGRRIGIVLAKACRNLIHKAGFKIAAMMQFRDEQGDGLRRPDTKPGKSLRVRFGLFVHLEFPRAGFDNRTMTEATGASSLGRGGRRAPK